MDWAEAWRLLEVLLTDPSSQVAAVLGGWDFPVTRDGLVLRDLYDLQHRSKAKKKPDPYPRPWDVAPKRFGTAVSVAEYEAVKDSLRAER